MRAVEQMGDNTYSVLMCVYAKENADNLKQSICSMLKQTVVPNEFVIVCDGTLTEKLNSVIQEQEEEYKGLFKIIRLEANYGIGYASDIGLRACTCTYVAKMDSDDISDPKRIEKLLEKFNSDPELSMVGTYIGEFEKNPEEYYCIRKVPLKHEDIVNYSRRRQPFNNVSIMYKREAVIACGGYNNLRRCEDYDMYIRFLQKGYKTANIEDVLVYVRADQTAVNRRFEVDTLKNFCIVRWNIYRSGFSSFWDFIIPCMGKICIWILPGKIQTYIYKKFLRKNLNR